MNDFSTLGLLPELAAAFAKMGFPVPTRAQVAAIPEILAGKDTILQSETGTGKTFAYLAPSISRSSCDPSRGPVLLVVCPTQELAVQVSKQASLLLEASGMKADVPTCLGGSPFDRQESALKKKPLIVVGTPGRTADLIRMRILKISNLTSIVLDEADRLASKEYRTETEFILESLNSSTSRILASATISAATRRWAEPFLRSPVSLDLLSEGVLSRDIEHWAFYVEHRKRLDFVRKLENAIAPKRCLIFASSADRVLKAVTYLTELGLPVDAIQARQDKERKRVALERFIQGSLRYLVTTDLGARGLDVPNITHIISLDFPDEPSWYVHRAGRTGRAGEKGISIILADAWELKGASKAAIERGFVFRTKVLDNGHVLEPPVEQFFAKVDEGQAEKLAYRRGKALEASKGHSDTWKKGR
jgi:superfamily II DNA/RNA helicase